MISLLANLPPFKDIDEGIVRLVEPLFELYYYPATATIFEQKDIANHLYLLVEGAVDVVFKPYDSPPMTITSLRPGNFFGWSAAIGNVVYTSSAICQEDSEVFRISGRKLRQLCKKHPTAGRIVLQLLADSVSSRWSNAQEQIHTLLNQSVSNTH
jgi:CRP-like cAMP-binding protein